MKSGMEIMLESMGIQVQPIKELLDPEKIKQVLAKIEKMCVTVDEINAAVLRVEIELQTMPQEKAFVLINDNYEQAQKDVEEYVRSHSDN